MGDENPICTLEDYSKPSHEGYRNTIELPVGNNVVPLQSDTIRLVQNGCSFHGLRSEDPNQHLKDFLKVVDSLDLDDENRERTRLQDLSLYDNVSWNDQRDFAKPVKAIALPQDVPSTSDCCLIELENQVQRLMEAHLALSQPTQVNKVTTSGEICSGPHDTQYCMEDPEQAFIKYARVPMKREAVTDHIAGALPSDTVKSPKLSTSPVFLLRPRVEIKTQQPKEPEPTLKDEFEDLHLNLSVLEVLAHASIYYTILDKYVEILELDKNRSVFVREVPFTLPCRLGDSKPFDTLTDLGSCVNIIPLYLFKKLNIGLLEKTDHIFGLADGTKSYPIGIVKDVEVHIRKLKLVNDFYVIDMKKDPETPLLVGR
ncbi:MAK10-like protein [Tanacetum coccineum]|uniref:MAK10-like protein n=1 Tax=Tanacetum coccineum TaxID=301880 RepID=A0ABQ5BQW6_9ASTR